MTHNEIELQIGEVVAAMRETAEGPPFYMYGHRLEIANRLKAMTKTNRADKRYPLIALKLDIPAAIVRGSMINYTLNIAIITATSAGLIASERKTQTFQPILYPLYDDFFIELKRSGLFSWDALGLEKPLHTKIDRYYDGKIGEEKNVKNLFDDPVDAIELVDLKINSKIKYC